MYKNVLPMILTLACTPSSFALAQAAAAPAHPPAAAPAPAARPAAAPAPSAAHAAAPAKPTAAPPQGKPGGPPPTAAGEPGCNHEDCPMHQHGHDDHAMPAGHWMMGGDDDKPAAMVEHMLDRLGVSDTVRKKVEDLTYEAKKRAIALRADADRAHLELEHLLSQDLPDTDTVLKQMDKAGQAQTELMKVWTKVQLEGAKLLTPEQRAQLKQFMHHGMHGDEHEHEHPHGH